MRESKLWSLHVLAGLVIFVLLGGHMMVMHLDSLMRLAGFGPREVLAFEVMRERALGAGQMVGYVVLLGAALYHGLYGLRNILSELNLRETADRFVSWALSIAGVLLFVYGAYAAIAAHGMAHASGGG